MIGQTISHYRIIEKLGEGGMGVVYKAQDLALDRMVAIKFLPPHLSASGESKARFTQEAKAAAALNHPNILGVYEIDERDGKWFFVMEYVNGTTLKQRLTSQGAAIQAAQAIDWAIQIAEGLKAAHQRDIVHRDVKPENVMIDANGKLTITIPTKPSPSSPPSLPARRMKPPLSVSSLGIAPCRQRFTSRFLSVPA